MVQRSMEHSLLCHLGRVEFLRAVRSVLALYVPGHGPDVQFQLCRLLCCRQFLAPSSILRFLKADVFDFVFLF